MLGGKICKCQMLCFDFERLLIVLACFAGEASASTMWDNNAWMYFYNTSTTEGVPPLLTQDFIHALQPDARFIAMLRDPVER